MWRKWYVEQDAKILFNVYIYIYRSTKNTRDYDKKYILKRTKNILNNNYTKVFSSGKNDLRCNEYHTFHLMTLKYDLAD